jgi:polar amino acid transport system substrate-binding protein
MKAVVIPWIVLVLLAGSAAAEPVTVVTEQWPPYNYAENGEIRGVMTEIVRATLETAGIPHEIRVYPWARAYKVAKNRKNVLIYSIFKLPNRERHFQWIPISGLSTKMYLFRPRFRDNIRVDSLEDARRYRIGVTRETSTHHFLLAHGFVEGQNLFPVTHEIQNAFKAAPKRHTLDLTTGDRLSLAHWLEVGGFPADYWTPVLLLFEETLYMAFGIRTDPAMVDRVRAALTTVRAEGKVDRVIRKYEALYP